MTLDDFVVPHTERLPLSGGQYVDIRKRLNHGETEDMLDRMMTPLGTLNRRWVRTGKILAYLLGWSLTRDGEPREPIPFSLAMSEQDRIDTIRSLDPDRAVEIYKAIEAHEEATDQKRAAQKKILNGGRKDEATSPSPSSAGGGSNGSENSTQTTTTSS